MFSGQYFELEGEGDSVVHGRNVAPSTEAMCCLQVAEL